MKVVYENKLKDLCVFTISHFYRSPLNYIIMFVFVILLSIPTILSNSNSLLDVLFEMITLIIIYLLFMMLFLLVVVFLSTSSKKNKNILTIHTIELFDNCYIETTSLNKNEYKWETIVKLNDSKRYLFIYINSNAAHIIPKNSFASDDECKQFINYIKSKIKI